MSENILIPEGAQVVRLVVSEDAMLHKRPVYVSLPVFAKPVIQKFRAYNVTEHAESSADHSMQVSVDEFRACVDFNKDLESNPDVGVDPLKSYIESGVVTPKFYKLEQTGTDEQGNAKFSYVEVLSSDVSGTDVTDGDDNE